MTDSENRSGMLMVIFSISMVLLLFVLYFIIKNTLIVICYFIDQRKKVALIEIKEKDSATTKSRYKKFHIYNTFVFIVNDVVLIEITQF